MGAGRTIVLSLLFTAMIAGASAQTITSKSYSYFTINGKTAAELDRELSRRGPMMNSTGMRHPGGTQMKFDGSVTYEGKTGSCGVKSAVIRLHTKLILPRWTNRGRADEALATIWDTLSRDIKRHEERHAEIARQHARKLELALVGLRPRKTCPQMESAVADMTDKMLAAHDADQQRFDRVEAASFERRMERMLRFKVDAMKNGG